MSYKGYFIEELFSLITVQFNGDDLVFNTVDEAKAFIDSLQEA